MGDEAIHLLKRSRIEKKLDAFPRRQLAFAMLAPRLRPLPPGRCSVPVPEVSLVRSRLDHRKIATAEYVRGATRAKTQRLRQVRSQKIRGLPGKVDSKLRNQRRRGHYITWRWNRQSSFLEGQSQLATAHPSRMPRLMPPITRGNIDSMDCHPTRKVARCVQLIALLLC